jgi:hypothetical protein
MPNPKCLKIGDLVRFTKLPDEWSRPGCYVPSCDIAFMKKMVKRSWPSRVCEIDDNGSPWISAKTYEKGRLYWHKWKIAESSGWRLVQRIKQGRQRPH